MTIATQYPRITALHVERRDRWGRPEAGHVRYGSLDLLWTLEPRDWLSGILITLYPEAAILAMSEAERVDLAKKIVTVACAHNGRRE